MKLPVLLVATVSLVLTACFPVDRPARPEPEPDVRACTEIGCRSLLTVELPEADLVVEATYGVEICVDGDCTGTNITIDAGNDRGEAVLGEADGVALRADEDLVEYQLPDEGYGETAKVSFTLTDADGEVLAETQGEEVPLERSQPNGPGCPPVCFTGRLTV